MNIDGSGRRRLTRREDMLPAWSPDGRKIAFERNEGIYLMDPDGSNIHRLLSGSEPAWSPDSRQLAFWGVTPPHGTEIFVVNRDGSHRRRVASAGQGGGLSWGRTS